MKKLRVFYGWSRINKIRKRIALSVIFENDIQDEKRTRLFIRRMQDTVYIRLQTEKEQVGADEAMRMFTEYSVYLDDKPFNGSLEAVLKHNSLADKNHVSEAEREEIKKKLKLFFLEQHPDYKEPR